MMSLRLRLLASTLAGLVLSALLSGGMAVLRASDAVRTELGAAMAVGRQVLGNGVGDLGTPQGQPGEVMRLVATFDGNRHLRAVLLDQAGRTVTQSHPLLSDPPAPGWFVWLVTPRLPSFSTAVPSAYGGGAILLAPEPADEVGEVWKSLADTVLELGGFCLLTSGLVFWVAGRALRPLRQMSDAFGRIGAGDYAARVATGGAAEVARLGEGLNRMAGQLATMAQQNRRLHEQLLTLQEEERADLARDLHDEVGPHLFSVQVTAAGIDRLVAAGRNAAIPAEIAAIRESVGHVQRHVRAILAQLRPLPALEFGLQPAIDRLVAFWGERHPGTRFAVAIDPDAGAFARPLQEVAYRVVQESLTNAFRHGRPGCVGIAIQAVAGQVTVRVTDDGAEPAISATDGYGLAGMRERVSALGGALHAGVRTRSTGWEVQALLPFVAAGEPAS